MAVFKEMLEGKFIKLRDVTFEDIPEIIKLRTDPRLSRYIHPINPDPEVQRKWLETQKKKRRGLLPSYSQKIDRRVHRNNITL